MTNSNESKRVLALINKCKTSDQFMRIYDYIDITGALFDTYIWIVFLNKYKSITGDRFLFSHDSYLHSKWAHYVSFLECYGSSNARVKHARLKLSMIKARLI